jgi:Raf kinase inhibitor-like YbhB/YbcL family protein
MDNRVFFLPVLVMAVSVIITGCTSAPASSPVLSLPPTSPSGQAIATSGTLSLQIDALSPGAVLPDVYTCKGDGESPPVSWNGIPGGTKSLVLILEDPDAPGGLFTHWLVYNIPPQSMGIEQGQTYAKTLSGGAQQGESTPGSRGYYYPCPPPATTHRYIFRLYALDEVLTLPTADRASIDKALAGHTIAGTEFLTTVTR